MEQDNVIAVAEDILTRRYGGTQKLVDATRLPSVLETGAARIVVVRAVTEATDVTAAARQLRNALPA